jgi:hypothetical protein
VETSVGSLTKTNSPKQGGEACGPSYYN